MKKERLSPKKATHLTDRNEVLAMKRELLKMLTTVNELPIKFEEQIKDYLSRYFDAFWNVQFNMFTENTEFEITLGRLREELKPRFICEMAKGFDSHSFESMLLGVMMKHLQLDGKSDCEKK